MTALNGIIDFMQDLGFEVSVINSVVKTLDEGRESVGKVRQVDPVASLSFGDIPEGTELADHTRLARAKVREALEDMMTGLSSYRDALTTLVSDTDAVTDDTVTSISRLQAAEQCVVTPSFSAPSQCSAPTEEG